MLPVVKQALPRGLRGIVHWYNVAVPRRSGGIGRRAGLKIRWCESTVSVRARPPVLMEVLQIGVNVASNSTFPAGRCESLGSSRAAVGCKGAFSIVSEGAFLDDLAPRGQAIYATAER